MLLMALLVPALLSAQEFLLYKPNPVSEAKVPASPDQGVLVQRVKVKRGDTLKKISRQHLGVSSWFPQVLLFNTIHNPDLIRPGQRLLVPVRPGHGVAVAKSGKRGRKHHAVRRESTCPKPAEQAKAQPQTFAPAAPSRAAATLGEQENFQQAKRAYLNGQYQKSLDLFDTFLRKFPNSDLAADAALYRADCLYRLSGQ
jgi:TolA-binding protein